MIAVEAFKQTDTDYLDEEKGQQKDAGSTASTAVLIRDKIFVANVGDSRVVASRAGSGILGARSFWMDLFFSGLHVLSSLKYALSYW